MQPQAVVVGARQATAFARRGPLSATEVDEVAPYRLTRHVHSGGVFDLFRAAARGDAGPGCYVLKRARDGVSPEMAAAMLRREATVAAAVQHPSLTCVLAAETRSPQPYLLLPFRDGVSLRQMLALSDAFISVSRALNIVRQVAEALAALHAAGWLHGQVRPDHVLLSPQGQVTVIDLMRARRRETAECDVADVAAIDAIYAAPEMSQHGRRQDSAIDVYSLGVALFEILTGRPPFECSSPRELMIKHRRDAVPDIRAARPDVTLEVAHLLRLMLAKDSLRRPTDEELVRWLAELEIAALAL
ncbi:MAG TPA: protein kinase [Pirellulaceae bacterium]|jgi:serine/threonine-protein kinase